MDQHMFWIWLCAVKDALAKCSTCWQLTNCIKSTLKLFAVGFSTLLTWEIASVTMGLAITQFFTPLEKFYDTPTDPGELLPISVDNTQLNGPMAWLILRQLPIDSHNLVLSRCIGLQFPSTLASKVMLRAAPSSYRWAGWGWWELYSQKSGGHHVAEGCYGQKQRGIH